MQIKTKMSCVLSSEECYAGTGFCRLFNREDSGFFCKGDLGQKSTQAHTLENQWARVFV